MSTKRTLGIVITALTLLGVLGGGLFWYLTGRGAMEASSDALQSSFTLPRVGVITGRDGNTLTLVENEYGTTFTVLVDERTLVRRAGADGEYVDATLEALTTGSIASITTELMSSDGVAGGIDVVAQP